MAFLHQTTTMLEKQSKGLSCFLWHSYIKPQPYLLFKSSRAGCFLWHSYIKPQPHLTFCTPSLVVSYGIPTSNHNQFGDESAHCEVVSYGIPTSNHNRVAGAIFAYRLFLMAFLHQTTTGGRIYWLHALLFLMAFLHQTTTCSGENALFQAFYFHSSYQEMEMKD